MIDLNEMASQMYEVALKREKNSPYMNSLTQTRRERYHPLGWLYELQ